MATGSQLDPRQVLAINTGIETLKLLTEVTKGDVEVILLALTLAITRVASEAKMPKEDLVTLISKGYLAAEVSREDDVRIVPA